ncbi:MAG: hypothetical protein U1E42_08605 [Rhodospirillales bacterium]
MHKPLTGLVAIAFALSATAPVFAATQSKATAESCQSMAAEVEQAITANPNAKKLDAAKKLQGEGSKLCDAGKYSEGVKKYKTAMADLTPKTSKKK